MTMIVAVQEERGPRKPKHNQLCPQQLPGAFSRIPTDKLRLIYTQTNHFESNSTYELAAQIFLTAIKQARRNSGFGHLRRHSQNIILGHLWAPLFILKAAHWPSDTASFFPFLQKVIKHIKLLELDGSTMEFFENILLCRVELLEDPEEVNQANAILEKSLEALNLLTASNRTKFTNILLSSTLLFTPSAVALHSLLFKPIIGIVPIETVIATI
ncbi:hypothetical protein NQ318_014313 [Aromia moschata]|uniref:Uncharacterized protein n=1 Tax=Aromia moschata TaxID=1265417 RepID=A0AAV8YZ02_9CUCU|nr:hypothetical protein NQ318_014313 [Aromia moschata]